MSAVILLHPTVATCPALIARIERETGRRGMWVDHKRAELEPVDDVSDYIGTPAWEQDGGHAA